MAIGRLAWSLGWGYETLFGIVNVAILAVVPGALRDGAAAAQPRPRG